MNSTILLFIRGGGSLSCGCRILLVEKKEFCEWLKREGGARGQLRSSSIVSYVESISACSEYVRLVMKLDADFYMVEDAATVEKLIKVMKADPYFYYFTNFLQIQPTTAIKRYLDFCRDC